MRHAIVLAAALGISGISAQAAEAAPKYRLCNDPQRSYKVVAVQGVTCATGKALAGEYYRRLTRDGADAELGRIWGWTCGPGRGGVFYGLYGTRNTCFKGKAHVRFDYRGE